MRVEQKVKILSRYLDIDAKNIEILDKSNNFKTEDGIYLVLTEEEAKEAMTEKIIDIICDIGVEIFTDIKDIIFDCLDDFEAENMMYNEIQSMVDEFSHDDLLDEADYYKIDLEDFIVDFDKINEIENEKDCTRGEALVECATSDEIEHIKNEIVDRFADRISDIPSWIAENIDEDFVFDRINHNPEEYLNLDDFVDEVISWYGYGELSADGDYKELDDVVIIKSEMF